MEKATNIQLGGVLVGSAPRPSRPAWTCRRLGRCLRWSGTPGRGLLWARRGALPGGRPHGEGLNSLPPSVATSSPPSQFAPPGAYSRHSWHSGILSYVGPQVVGALRSPTGASPLLHLPLSSATSRLLLPLTSRPRPYLAVLRPPPSPSRLFLPRSHGPHSPWGFLVVFYPHGGVI